MDITIETECSSCGGTGLYQGFAEKRSQAVICVTCSGTGCRKIAVRKFAGRKQKEGITSIRAGSGTILDNVSKAQWYSYSEFEAMIPAPKIDS
jgi:DnaJ-class molecular chaperone